MTKGKTASYKVQFSKSAMHLSALDFREERNDHMYIITLHFITLIQISFNTSHYQCKNTQAIEYMNKKIDHYYNLQILSSFIQSCKITVISKWKPISHQQIKNDAPSESMTVLMLLITSLGNIRLSGSVLQQP